METRDKKAPVVEDQEGWFLGLGAVFKTLFGTDVEVRIRHGGIKEQVEHAEQAVGRMAHGATELLRALGGEEPQDEKVVELESIIKDL